MSEPKYAELVDRIKAAFTDMIVVVIFMFIIANVFASMEDVPTNYRIAAFTFIVLIYDPLFTSLFGGTVGHMVNGLRVRRDSDHDKNIIFPLSVIRYIIKVFLGIISLFTVSSHLQGKAIHDTIVGSVVIRKKRLNGNEE